MAPVPEQTETQALAMVAAEVAAAPDGSHVVCLATPRHAFLARAHLAPGASHAALLCGPGSFGATFDGLSRALASQGVSALFVHPREPMHEATVLACCARFLRQRLCGAQTLALAAAGPCARAALDAACGLDVEDLLLLGPSGAPAEPQADLLRGRPLLLCTRGERRRVEPLAGLPHAARSHFALAGEAFDEVRADLLSTCVPFLCRGGQPVAPLHS